MIIISEAVLNSGLARESVWGDHEVFRTFKHSHLIAVSHLFSVVSTEAETVPSVFIEVKSVFASWASPFFKFEIRGGSSDIFHGGWVFAVVELDFAMSSVERQEGAFFASSAGAVEVTDFASRNCLSTFCTCSVKPCVSIVALGAVVFSFMVKSVVNWIADTFLEGFHTSRTFGSDVKASFTWGADTVVFASETVFVDSCARITSVLNWEESFLTSYTSWRSNSLSVVGRVSDTVFDGGNATLLIKRWVVAF